TARNLHETGETNRHNVAWTDKECVPLSDTNPPPQETSKTREAVIQEIFETEEDLLRLFHICMRMFILPLRVQKAGRGLQVYHQHRQTARLVRRHCQSA
ncbi:hypothetical protein BDZ97DRAFT_1993890, partial [Flammula alnicola]